MSEEMDREGCEDEKRDLGQEEMQPLPQTPGRPRKCRQQAQDQQRRWRWRAVPAHTGSSPPSSPPDTDSKQVSLWKGSGQGLGPGNSRWQRAKEGEEPSLPPQSTHTAPASPRTEDSPPGNPSGPRESPGGVTGE